MTQQKHCLLLDNVTEVCSNAIPTSIQEY